MDGAGSYSVAHRAGLPPTELTGMWGWILLRSPHQGRGSPPAPAPTQQRPASDSLQPRLTPSAPRPPLPNTHQGPRSASTDCRPPKPDPELPPLDLPPHMSPTTSRPFIFDPVQKKRPQQHGEEDEGLAVEGVVLQDDTDPEGDPELWEYILGDSPKKPVPGKKLDPETPSSGEVCYSITSPVPHKLAYCTG